ncbi:Virus attachment protein p12 family, partial [Dysosmobacter welbionis]
TSNKYTGRASSARPLCPYSADIRPPARQEEVSYEETPSGQLGHRFRPVLHVFRRR